MLYVYICAKCGKDFERNLAIEDREIPLKGKCPECGRKGGIRRDFNNQGLLYDGIKSLHTRAREAGGSDWNDHLKALKKASGRKNTIEPD